MASVQVGDRFGRLVAIRISDREPTRMGIYWEFRCDCGCVETRVGTQVKYWAKKGVPACKSCGHKAAAAAMRASEGGQRYLAKKRFGKQWACYGSLYRAHEIAGDDEW